MENRLAQVRALVDERWRVARVKREETRVREWRVGAFERCLHGDLLVKNATASVDIVALENEIVVEAAEEGKCRLELAMREKQLERLQANVWTKQHQIELLKNALKEQQESVDATWAELLEDKAQLRDQDNNQAEKDLQAQCEEERITQELRCQLEDLENVITAKKIETDTTKNAVQNLKHRKRSLEVQLQTANGANHALKEKIAKLRGPNYAAVVEERVDAILHELDEMGAR